MISEQVETLLQEKNQELNDQNTYTSHQGLEYSTSAHDPDASDVPNTTQDASLGSGNEYNLDDNILDDLLGGNFLDDDLDDDIVDDNIDDGMGNDTGKTPAAIQRAMSPGPEPVSLGPDGIPTDAPVISASAGGKYPPWPSTGLDLDEPLPPQEVVDDL